MCPRSLGLADGNVQQAVGSLFPSFSLILLERRFARPADLMPGDGFIEGVTTVRENPACSHTRTMMLIT